MTDPTASPAAPATPRAPHAWINAARPRTLPLALACIILGSFLAAADDAFDPAVALLAALTATLLQILSNLANDYGDYTHGADQAGRIGPIRALASGQITPRAMRVALGVTALLAALSGLALLIVALGADVVALLGFVGLGAGALLAAFLYTMGRRPYGYLGLGDMMVFVFFGLVGVLGTYYLHAERLDAALVLPATSSGLLAVGVLNVNNIRDINSDRRAGKQTIPVRLGPRRARVYHGVLLTGAVLAALAYVLIDDPALPRFLFLLAAPLLVRNGIAVWRTHEPRALIPWLKQMAAATLVFVTLFGLGQIV